MEQRSIHGEVKAKVYRNILLNRTFTVVGLCAETGLKPDQVYPILAKLRKQEVLSVKSLDEQTKSAHRPSQLYTLSDDIEKRKSLAAEVAPFLQLSPESLSHSDTLSRVDAKLSEISTIVQGIPGSLDMLAVSYTHVFLQQIAQAMKELADSKDDLEIAWYECNRSRQHSLYGNFKKTRNTFEILMKQVEALHRRLNLRLDELNAEERFSDIAKRLFTPGRCTLHQTQEVLQTEYSNNTDFFIRKILSAVFARVAFATEVSGWDSSQQQIEYALAEACGRFGSDMTILSKWMDYLMSISSGDEFHLYKLANSYLLSNSEEQALKFWKQFLGRHNLERTLGGLKELTVYRRTTVLSGELAQIGKEQLQGIENRLGLMGAISMASISPVQQFGTGYVLKPTIPDWLEPESEGFIVSASLRTTQNNLFVYGPIADIVQFPGLPRLRLATALVRVGVKVDVAWRLAEILREGKVVLALHSPETADNSIVGGIQGILPEFRQEGSFVVPAATPQDSAAAARAVA